MKHCTLIYRFLLYRDVFWPTFSTSRSPGQTAAEGDVRNAKKYRREIWITFFKDQAHIVTNIQFMPIKTQLSDRFIVAYFKIWEDVASANDSFLNVVLLSILPKTVNDWLYVPMVYEP